MLVVDASVAVAACHSPVGFARLRGNELVAPQLMLVEASSVLHEMAWRRDLVRALEEKARPATQSAGSDPSARRSDRGRMARRRRPRLGKDLRRAIRGTGTNARLQ